MKKIIVSGFSPFGVYPVNSSEFIVRRLTRVGVQGFQIIPVIFSAKIPSENRGEELAELAQKSGASGIISLGMASDKRGLCIEKEATNIVDNTKYCPPDLQGTLIDAGQIYGAKISIDLAPWNIDAFFEACRASNVPAESSCDAGGFCCNHLAFQSAVAFKSLGLPYIFIHVPCCPEAVPNQVEFVAASKTSLSVEKMSQGLKLLIQNATLK